MINVRTWIGLLGAGVLLVAADAPKQKAVVSNTQHLDFPSGGLLRMVHSTGDVTIQGWDQPGIEITTIKSTKQEYDAQDREKAAREFQQIEVQAARKDDELVVTTQYPHLVFPPPTPYGKAVNFNLEYHIKLPRNARVAVDHNDGNIVIEDVSGEIHVAAKQGLILLHLPDDRQYAIDAKSDTGNVNSDFPGTRRLGGLFFTGHQFVGAASGAAQKLYLRIRYGDIIILKENSPARLK